MFEVVDIETSAVVHTVSTAGKSDRDIEKIERGILRNLDMDRFTLREIS